MLMIKIERGAEEQSGEALMLALVHRNLGVRINGNTDKLVRADEN